MPACPGPGGFTLVEVLVALCLVASVGVLASSAALAVLAMTTAAHAEAVGLAAASAKVEELFATEAAVRASGNDELPTSIGAVARVWRVLPDEPAAGLQRLEVTVRWSRPSVTLLSLVAVAP